MAECKNYILVWIGEEAKWYYFMDKFDESQFPDGYVDYYITVLDGIIIEDTFDTTNRRKYFEDIYDISKWEV